MPSARFVHNQFHDVAIACAGLDAPDGWDLYETVRRTTYAALSRRPRHEVSVMTNALCVGAPVEVLAWSKVVELAMRRGVPLIPVRPDVELEENQRRLRSEDRVGWKMVDAARLAAYRDVDRIQCPGVPEALVLDATRLTPAEAAGAIRAHVAGLGERLRPATPGHLRFRPAWTPLDIGVARVEPVPSGEAPLRIVRSCR